MNHEDKLNEEARQALERVIDPKGNIVLHVFGNDALLMRPAATYQPYVIAYGYDASTGEWSHGSYQSDLSRAWQKAHPKIIEDACVTWELEDVSERLDVYGIEATEDAIAEVVGNHNVTKYLKDNSIASGYEDIDLAIEECLADGLVHRKADERDDLAERNGHDVPGRDER